MRTVKVRKREMDTSKLSDWLVEDTHDFDEIRFEVDENLTGLYLYLLFVNSEGTGGVEALEGNVWTPSHSFTSVSGSTRIQLIAVDDNDYPSTNNIRWSTKYTTITIPENIEADTLVPVPQRTQIEDIAEELI